MLTIQHLSHPCALCYQDPLSAENFTQPPSSWTDQRHKGSLGVQPSIFPNKLILWKLVMSGVPGWMHI